ncbi:MAG: hypothetical protein AAGB19_09455 [Cyanobacteria bacterium P01_F01_bin.3]
MDKVFEHIPLLMGVVSFIGAGLTWFDATIRKRYASERAVGHLTKNYESLSANVGHMDRMLDERLDAVQRENLELKMMLQVLITKAGGSSQFFGQSGQPQ